MISRTLHVLGLLLFVSGCEKVVINRGYDVNTADFSTIKIGTDTAKSVFAKLGSPTLRSSVLDENGGYRWFYSAKQMTKLGFMNPKTVRAKTYIITFNSSDIVKSVEQSSYENPVVIERDTVPAKTGKTKGIVKEVFGGMGKYLDAYSKGK